MFERAGNDLQELVYLNALRLVNGLGAVKIARLVDFFGSAERAWFATGIELGACLGPDKAVEAIIHGQGKINPQAEWEKIQGMGIKVSSPGREDYPLHLAQIYNPPPVLYYRGTLERFDLSLAIVGSRAASPYGRTVAFNLAKELSNFGFAIVSGLARGIDAAAHRGAIAAGGKTVAVLGNGIDVVYPRDHKALYEEVAHSGALVSEFPLGTDPVPGNFPARNRIISGICLGTLVVEGKEKSGSLITADFALEQGRDVFAIPGPVNYEGCRGPHKLIKQGAKLVEQVIDIIEEYAHLIAPSAKVELAEFNTPREYQPILKLLSLEPVHIDTICLNLQTTPEQIAGLLVHMELSGHIRQLRGGYYVVNFL